MDIILLYFSLKYKGDWNKIYAALEKKERIETHQIKELEKRVKKENIKYFTILDPHYPDSFKTCYKPPFVLFYKGNKELLKSNEFYFITGDTNKSQHVSNNIKQILHKAKNLKTINSLHKGVEELLYEKWPEKNNIIFVCANSINNPDSAINIMDVNLKDNLIISEYYDNEHVTKTTLRARNRLLVALSKAIILISSSTKSWTNNLVTHALNAGKEIYCMPDDPSNLSGNTKLIKDGANLITSFNDLM